MKIEVVRKIRSSVSTIGEMYINGKLMFYTLEDVERDTKIKGKTAIPKGTYRVIINYSNRFKQYMPLLLNVPNFHGVRIHSGNTADQSSGCLLVGTSYQKDFVGGSRAAYSKLMSMLNRADKREVITITIR